MEREFNTLCGFHESEIVAALHEVAQVCQLSAQAEAEALTMMRTFYDGYRFSTRDPERVYNPTLVLHFLRSLQKDGLYPEDLLDNNLSMDRNRIAYVAGLEGAEAIVPTILNEAEPLLVAKLSQRFGVADVLSPGKKSQDYLAALLYYLGVLTLGGMTPLHEYILKIPNLVVRELYVDRLRQLLLPDGDDQNTRQKLVRMFFTNGDLAPIGQFVEQRLFRAFDNRDYLTANELTIKTAFLTLLYNDQLYIIDSETAIQRTYADLTMMRRPDLLQHPSLRDLLFEFKYVALDAVNLAGAMGRNGKPKKKRLTGSAAQKMSAAALRALPEIQEKVTEARTQFQDYRQKLQAHYGERLWLRTYAVVALGFERVVWVEVE